MVAMLITLKVQPLEIQLYHGCYTCLLTKTADCTQQVVPHTKQTIVFVKLCTRVRSILSVRLVSYINREGKAVRHVACCLTKRQHITALKFIAWEGLDKHSRGECLADKRL